MSKAIEKLREAKAIVACCGYKCGHARIRINEAIALLEKEPELPEQEKMDIETIGILLEQTKNLQTEIERLKSLLRHAICPNCDASGCSLEKNVDQCQFCYEKHEETVAGRLLTEHTSSDSSQSKDACQPPNLKGERDENLESID